MDAFGNTKTVQQREDIQLNKFFLPFSGWFLTPKFRYYLYVWSSNPSQGDPAQVVGAGNLSYMFNRYVTFGAGITWLPERAQHRGPVPVLARRRRPPDRGRVLPRLVHDRHLAEGRDLHEVQVHGDARQQPEHARRERGAARQHDRHESFMLQWLPTTGEFGLYGTFGDYDDHEKLATRLAAHYTHSTEDKQSQPGTNGIENSQIRLTDGSVIFTPDLFGPGITVEKVKYQMVSVDGGLKYRACRWRPSTTGAGSATSGHEHRGHRGHRRHGVPGAVLGDGGAEDAAGLPERLGDLRRPLRRRLGAARGRTGTS